MSRLPLLLFVGLLVAVVFGVANATETPTMPGPTGGVPTGTIAPPEEFETPTAAPSPTRTTITPSPRLGPEEG